MKLYYAPSACSISPHVALIEAGLPFELVRVDFMRGKKLPDGRDLSAVSPKAYVPVLELDDGQILTEGAVMVQYIADRVPAAKLAPPNGTFERVRLQELLHFIATELHKGMTPLFSKVPNEEYKQVAIERVKSRLALLSQELGNRQFIFGDSFTIADGYLFYILRTWTKHFAGELPGNLVEYYARIAERPSMKATLAAEGISA
jgi:glutathione S-transferase